ncbi:Uncharacterised protein [Mycobacteroides abscessus subsp. abscessus]|nr:hypothetical protein [Mycobacteroides abscessus]SKQ88100.1 Uncharacterised protein [Mycobacteroides abscessus subsp. abscessus]
MARRGAEMSWEDPEYVVSEMFAAANSIPEGPPVGTIARRPDGAVIALRGGVCDERFWIYKWLDDDPNVPTVKDTNDADSWLQIRPDQWPDQAGLDWFPPGEGPIVPRPDPGSKDAGDWIKAQVVHSGGSLWRRDGYMWRGVGHTGGRSPLPSLARPGVAVTVVIDDDGELVSDLSKLACVDGDVEELLAEHGLLPDPTAQQEPALRERFPEQASAYVADPELAGVDDEPLPSGSLITPKPRVLPSLDCEEARDGTAWQAAFSNTVHRRGWKFWYVPAEREWHTDGGYDGSGPLNTLDFLTERGPYTEVLGDPS